MTLNIKHIKATLRNKHLKKYLLKNKNLTIQDYLNYDVSNEEKQDEIYQEILGVMRAFAPEMINYGTPIEEYPDDALFFGTRGFYIVETPDLNIEFFTNRNEALKYAKAISKNSWEVAKQSGWLD